MKCLHPRRLFDTGLLTEKGKKAYIFDSTGTDVITPFQAMKAGYKVYHDLKDYIDIPCGVCVACRQNRARSWSFRCLAELQGTTALFLTITYDDDSNPGYLLKKDLQDFHKRLRKAFGSFRFYACGEYGDTTHRPHYHGIYYGLEMPTDSTCLYENGDNSLYSSESLSKVWGKGFVVIGACTPSSIAYVSGYVSKKFETPGVFSLMSRRPGIGLEWFRLNAKPGEVVCLPSGEGGVIKGVIPRSAFPAFVHEVITDVDYTGLGPVSKTVLNQWRWAQDYCLKHPVSKRFR